MARVKRGTKARARRKRVLKLASGYYGTRNRLFRTAKEAVDRALAYAFRDRKVKKREFRKLWIVRLNAAARLHGLSYSALISKLKANNVLLDRRALAELAISDPNGFKAVVDSVSAAA
jgi:large subunit ribosomal protein L20